MSGTRFDLERDNRLFGCMILAFMIPLILGFFTLSLGGYYGWILIGCVALVLPFLCYAVGQTNVVFDDQTRKIYIEHKRCVKATKYEKPLGDYDSFRGVDIKTWTENGKTHYALRFNFTNGPQGTGDRLSPGDVAEKRKMVREMNAWWTEHCREMNAKKNIIQSPPPSAPIQNSIAPSAPLIADANDANQPVISTGNSEGNVVSDESTVHSWMQNNVQLPEYTKVFIENGFDRMVLFRNLSMEDLTLMGISKLGHRKQIMSEVAKLKREVSIEIADEVGYIPGAAGSSSVSDPPPAFH